MKTKNSGKIYVGIDMGTNSVGYAVTNETYDLKKFKGEPAWGSVIFDEGMLNDERRGHRTARKNIDRKKQRIDLLQQLFAKEISKVDSRFFVRLKESSLYREDKEDEYTIFADEEYTDKDYNKEYPTIHHLINELMENDAEHDVRLVYIACAWLLSHRGHFLSNISMDNLSSIKEFKSVYDKLLSFFENDKNCDLPWYCEYTDEIGDILKNVRGVNNKYLKLKEILYHGEKISKEASEEFPYNRDAILKLLCGGSVKVKDLFDNEEYDEAGSVSLGMDDDKLLKLSSDLGDDFDIIVALRSVYDWSTLVNVLGEYQTISKAKIAEYDTHKKDLKNLKYLIKKYCANKYDEVFRENDGGKYSSYTKGGKGSLNIEDFSKYLNSILKGISPDEEDEELLSEVTERITNQLFLPKQKNTNNRVIPCQLYKYELITLLNNAEHYLYFLSDAEDGITVKEKIVSIFSFKIPYYVGPLNEHSSHAWIKRLPGAVGKIYPWNFDKMVDLDGSEQEFIRRMTNVCTYLPGEDVLPKCSLLYQRYVVLNEINNIRIGEERISVELKQQLYNDLFLKYNKVTRKKIVDYFLANNIITKGDEELVSGIDININGTLSSVRAFKALMQSGKLSEEDVERIIERSTYSEDKNRLIVWLKKNYSSLSNEDIKYIASIRLKDFGRLSKKFLNGLEGCYCATGEVFTVVGALWNTQNNLNEIILTDNYTFKTEIEKFQKEYYSENHKSLSDRLDDMYVSNAVRRPIYRTLAIFKDIEKAFGTPDKIFVEMAREAGNDKKGKRTSTRLDQIRELYRKCSDEDVRELSAQLENMGEYANSKLQNDKLFLYYMQLGKCMYTGTPIRLEELNTKLYDIDHIYPQAYITDDSIINNKVLVLSEENGKKSDIYPIASDIRHRMTPFWKYLLDVNLISETKYKRLIRSTSFTEEEKENFINRQYVETTQATKVMATILKERYPNAEIVYCKAKLTSEFRHLFDIYKSRSFNDLHHAVDAYLNIVVGNIYNMKFTKNFNFSQKYSVNPKTVFTHEVKCGNQLVWDGTAMLDKVKKQAVKNNAHFVKFAYFKHGGLFDQMPVGKAEGLVPLKKNLPTEKYGGYNKAGVMFYIPVKYVQGKKTSIMILSVELLYGQRFLADEEFAYEYAKQRLKHITGKDVEKVSFPMGMRPWKVNTVLSLDGFRVCITGIGGGGKCLSAQPIVQFSESNRWKYYVSKLEKFNEKIKANKEYKYIEEYDKVSFSENLVLYDLFIDKFKDSIYQKRINNPIETFIAGRDKFLELSIEQQAEVLLNMLKLFSKDSTGGIDLTLINGKAKSGATVNFSSTISNWSNRYRDVRIIDMSPSGLWEKKSENLLELV